MFEIGGCEEVWSSIVSYRIVEFRKIISTHYILSN